MGCTPTWEYVSVCMFGGVCVCARVCVRVHCAPIWEYVNVCMRVCSTALIMSLSSNQK